jgi:hypothetical protein
MGLIKSMGFNNRKGAIELSINTIVILILALAFLGIGLFFINRIGSEADEINLDQQKVNLIRERLENMDGKFMLANPRISVKKSEFYDVYYGIKNLGSETETFSIVAGCESSLHGADPGKVDITHFDQFDISPSHTRVQIFRIDSTKAEPDMYDCVVYVFSGDAESEDLYATEHFSLEITP